MLGEPEGQDGSSVGGAVGVLRVAASEVWAELVAGEEGSVPVVGSTVEGKMSGVVSSG